MTFVGAVVVLVVGIGIGRWSAPSLPSASAEPDATRKPVAPPRLRPAATKGSSGDEVAGQRERRAEEEVCLPVSVLEAIAGAADIAVPEVDFFETGDRMIEVLGIDDGEKRRLQQAWRACRWEIKEAEVASANVIELPDGAVSFKLDPLVLLRAGKREGFAASATAILGADRAAALLAAKGGDRLLSGGGELVDFRVEVEESGSGRWRFRIEESRGESRKVWIADAIPEELTHLTDAAGIVRRVNDPTTEGSPE